MREYLMRTIRSRSYVLDVLVSLLLVTTIFFLVGQRNLSSQLKDVAEQNHSLNTQNKELLEQVKSCTDPKGACYKAGTARTRGVVTEINSTILLSSFCASRTNYKYPADVQRCIRQLKRK